MERRTALELRADGRTLVGPAMRYGDVSPTHRERWLPGSARVSPDLAPTLGHRTGRVLAYGSDVEVRDGRDALVVRARLPRTEVADIALDGVKSGRFRGWSVEFKARRQSRDAAGVRVIESADVPGLALVDEPSFPGSTVEARQRARPRITSKVLTGLAIDCKCADGDASVVEFLETAFREVEDLEVTAISRGAESVVSSTANDSLKLSAARDGSLRVDLRPLDTEAGRRTAELVRARVPVYARPVWDARRSDWTLRDDGVAEVSRAWFAYLLVRPVPEADARGLEPMEAAERRAAVAPLDDPGFGLGNGRLEPSTPLEAILRPSVESSTRRRVWL